MTNEAYNSQSYLPHILSQPNLVTPKKEQISYTIHYPKPDLHSLADRVNKTLEWSNHNRSIINRLTRNRFPSNYFSEMEKATLLRRSDKAVSPDYKLDSPKRKGIFIILIKVTFQSPQFAPKNMVKFDKGIKNEEIDQMLIQKQLVIYLKRIKST